MARAWHRKRVPTAACATPRLQVAGLQHGHDTLRLFPGRGCTCAGGSHQDDKRGYQSRIHLINIGWTLGALVSPHVTRRRRAGMIYRISLFDGSGFSRAVKWDLSDWGAFVRWAKVFLGENRKYRGRCDCSTLQKYGLTDRHVTTW